MKDAECVELVHTLEGIMADVCQTREQRTNLMTDCKEESSRHEQLVVQINGVRDQVRDQD